MNLPRQEEYLGENELLSYSVSLVTQGQHRFYTLTMPSDVLAHTCFVSTRQEDPILGFQRTLDEKRAQQIADYIDQGLGTIPTSIVLSAQEAANLEYNSNKKTIQFKAAKRAFLIIDGQHRVFGFSKASTKLRVPVVIYNNLTKRDESRLFIDINTKQRPVSPELLLDIKKLAEYESNAERLLGEVFDHFLVDPTSPLYGLLSPTDKTKGKITRVTFNISLRALLDTFGNSSSEEIFAALSPYVRAFREGCERVNASNAIVNATVFRAMMLLFLEVGQKVKDRFGRYTTDNFTNVLTPCFQRTRTNELIKPPRSYKDLYDKLNNSLKQTYTLY